MFLAGRASCTEDSVIVISGVSNKDLHLVGMCSSGKMWCPMCDYNWTTEDAMVICRELGYSLVGI